MRLCRGMRVSRRKGVRKGALIERWYLNVCKGAHVPILHRPTLGNHPQKGHIDAVFVGTLFDGRVYR